MRLLLHCCCGPCSLAVADQLRAQGHTVQGWFFNPNIHPPEELARREAVMREATREQQLTTNGPVASEASESIAKRPQVWEPALQRQASAHGRSFRSCPTGFTIDSSAPKRELARTLLNFLLYLARQGGRRCPACYELRLEATAKEAVRRGLDGFATTLTISPYQEVAAIERIGNAAAARHGLTFVCEDLRSHYHENCDRARELGLYQQNYCGCIFSALERNERRARRGIAKALRLSPPR